MHLLNGSRSPSEDPKPEVHPVAIQGLAAFKEAMTQAGMMATKPELQIVSDLLVLVANQVHDSAQAVSLLTLKIIYNFLGDIILICKPNGKIERQLRSIMKMIETGEKDDNLQEHFKRMQARQEAGRREGTVD